MALSLARVQDALRKLNAMARHRYDTMLVPLSTQKRLGRTYAVTAMLRSYRNQQHPKRRKHGRQSRTPT